MFRRGQCPALAQFTPRPSSILESRRAERERAEAAWRRLMERIYSAIRAEHGRAAAEKFFKAPSRGGKKQQDTPEA